MNKIAIFAVHIAIPVWWLIWVVISIQSGYDRGFILGDPTELPYPWLKVLQVCLLLAFELAILYAILRPDLLKWSLARALIAFVLFCGIASVQNRWSWLDSPGYTYIPGAFAISTVGILAIWLLITFVHAVFMLLSKKRAHNNAA